MGSVETENVVGIVRGSELPDEYLVITAHLDHVGYGRNGGSRGDITDQIHNGADDDGSGSVALLCLLYTSPSPRDGLLSRMPSSA